MLKSLGSNLPLPVGAPILGNNVISSARDNALSREDDRKYNVLCFGIEECSETLRIDRLNSDLDKVTSLVSSLDSHVDKSSIRDSFRLGKFKKDSSNPRPILVKFTRSADAASILYKRGSITGPFVVKPDLSPEQRVVEKILLKERWSLIQSGVDRKDIKLRQGNIYVKNKKYGQVVDEKFSLQGESIEYKTQYTSSKGEVSNPLAPSSPQVTVPLSQDVNPAQSNHDQPPLNDETS